MTDRIYWRIPGRAWHAQDLDAWWRSVCGLDGRHDQFETADRLPPDGHFCGRCSRIIAARTDIETVTVAHG